jgi:hypothetical protein
MMMVSPNDGKLPATMVTDDQRRAAEHTASQLLAYSQAQTQNITGATQNQEALKKSIHIQNILTHLRKATPGAPLPPYMFDNKTMSDNSTVTYTVSPEPVTLPHQWGQVTTTTTISTQATSAPHTQGNNAQQLNTVKPITNKPGVCVMQTPSPADLKNPDLASVAQIQQSLGIMGPHYTMAPGSIAWHQPPPVTTVGSTPGAIPLGGSAPAALLVSSISESAISGINNHSCVRSATSESSLSNSGSFDGMHRQVTPQDPNMLTAQFDSQMSESGDTDICYETYLIDTSAAGGDEAMALQQAQAAVLQQLAYNTTDPDDGTQTVVVMDTQEVAFLDDIECEIEIQDAESLPEPLITEGIALEEAGELTSESTSTTPLAEASAISNTGPSVCTEVVQQHTPEDGQIGQLGMQLSGEVDLGVSPGTPLWDSHAEHPGQLAPGNLGQAVPSLGQIHQQLKPAQGAVLEAPGWFGKGLGIKKTKRKRSK